MGADPAVHRKGAHSLVTRAARERCSATDDVVDAADPPPTRSGQSRRRPAAARRAGRLTAIVLRSVANGGGNGKSNSHSCIEYTVRR